MTVSNDPQYQALARGAAAALGGGPDLTRAILGQWQCELGANDAYPPRRNNPGNVARGFASGLGIPFTVIFPNPQPGNPIVTFRSPEDGARCYVKGLATFGRYAAARAAARRDDGAAFLRAVTAAGWGTSAKCALSVYGSTSTSSGPTAILAGATAGGPDIPEGKILTSADIDTIVAWAASLGGGDPLGIIQGQALGVVRSTLLPFIGRPWNKATRDAVQAALGTAARNAVPDPTAGIAAVLGALPGAVGDIAGGLIVNGAILAVVVGLGYLGVRSIITSPTKLGR